MKIQTPSEAPIRRSCFRLCAMLTFRYSQVSKTEVIGDELCRQKCNWNDVAQPLTREKGNEGKKQQHAQANNYRRHQHICGHGRGGLGQSSRGKRGSPISYSSLFLLCGSVVYSLCFHDEMTTSYFFYLAFRSEHQCRSFGIEMQLYRRCWYRTLGKA